MVTSRPQTVLLGALAVILGVALRADPSRATCDPTADPDKTDIANARAAVAANCDCAGATSHASYVSCAVQQANLILVNKSCAGAVKRCAARSTCGKRTGAVTCCVTKTSGTKCKIKRDRAHCTAPSGATACVGAYASCCDACGSGGCATSTTTSSTTTTSTSSSTTTTFPFVPCTGGSGAPVCDGACAPGLQCVLYYDWSQPGPGTCACFPVGAIPCTTALFPQCGGACPDGKACGAFEDFTNPSFRVCACIDPAERCTSDPSGRCVTVGYCPQGSACIYSEVAPHANCPCCGCGTPF